MEEEGREFGITRYGTIVQFKLKTGAKLNKFERVIDRCVLIKKLVEGDR